MSIAFLDPGNIESDLQAGAVAGFKVLSLGRHAGFVRGVVSQLRQGRPQFSRAGCTGGFPEEKFMRGRKGSWGKPLPERGL